MNRRLFVLSLLSAALFTGCPADPAPTTPTTTDADTGPLVVYSGRSESLVGPLFERFTKETGIELSVRYGKTPALASQLLSERDESPCDVIFAQDSGYLGALSDQNLLARVPLATYNAIDERFRDHMGRWVGISGRARVLVVSKSLSDEELPKTLEELTDSRWKGKLGWAPGNSSFQAHLSLLRNTWGEVKTKGWLEGMMANKPKVYPKNSPQVDAVDRGEIQIGWVNHYYLYRKGPEVKARNYSFPTAGNEGNVLMVAGVGVREGSPRQEAAEKLVDWLTMEAAQTYFAQETFEYPTRPGVKTHERVPPIDTLNLAKVEQSHLADVGSTVQLLQELGLQ